MINRLQTTLLLSLPTVLMVLMGSAIGGQAGMVAAFLMTLAMNFFSSWFSDKIVLKRYGAQEVGDQDQPGLSGPVRRLATQAGLPMPRVYITPSASPNAFATDRNPNHGARGAMVIDIHRTDFGLASEALPACRPPGRMEVRL